MRSTHLAASGLGIALALAGVTAVCAAEPYHLVKTVRVGGSPHWQTLTFDETANRVFFSNGEEVTVLDAETANVVGRVPGIGDAHGLVLMPKLGKGYVANGDRGTVSVFDMHTLAVSEEIPTDGGTDELAFDPKSGRLYSMNGGAHDLSVIDLVKNKTVATIPLGGQPEMAVADGAGHLFVNVKSTGELAVIDTATNTIAHRYALPACDTPHGLGFDPKVDRLFMSCGGGQLLVLDPADGHTVALLKIGTESDTVQVDSRRGLVFSANATGTLSVVTIKGPQTFSVTEMKTDIGARIMTFSPLTGRLFIPTAALKETTPNTASPDQPRYRFQPDTVRMLVYDPAAAAAPRQQAKD